MTTTVGVTSFRNNISAYMDKAQDAPIVVHKHHKTYILMTKEHYVDLINKIKAPNIMQMPGNVHTIVHFQARSC
jgi:PHD/YefM family antitoxin component YafN of YafNO toxin-antitoxin module